jgi:hypothetical protein
MVLLSLCRICDEDDDQMKYVEMVSLKVMKSVIMVHSMGRVVFPILSNDVHTVIVIV